MKTLVEVHNPWITFEVSEKTSGRVDEDDNSGINGMRKYEHLDVIVESETCLMDYKSALNMRKAIKSQF